jgi:hypothetical protein
MILTPQQKAVLAAADLAAKTGKAHAVFKARDGPNWKYTTWKANGHLGNMPAGEFVHMAYPERDRPLVCPHCNEAYDGRVYRDLCPHCGCYRDPP